MGDRALENHSLGEGDFDFRPRLARRRHAERPGASERKRGMGSDNVELDFADGVSDRLRLREPKSSLGIGCGP
jgi:hypothetical protein